jgi:hypothetical protein
VKALEIRRNPPKSFRAQDQQIRAQEQQPPGYPQMTKETRQAVAAALRANQQITNK